MRHAKKAKLADFAVKMEGWPTKLELIVFTHNIRAMIQADNLRRMSLPWLPVTVWCTLGDKGMWWIKAQHLKKLFKHSGTQRLLIYLLVISKDDCQLKYYTANIDAVTFQRFPFQFKVHKSAWIRVFFYVPYQKAFSGNAVHLNVVCMLTYYM